MFRAAETTPSDVLEGHDGFGLLEIDAEVLFGMGKRVIYRPQWGKGTWAYGFSKKDEQSRRDAAFAARLLIKPQL